MLGDKIKELRRLRGWSQEMLAIKSGLSRSHISMMELRKYVHPRTDVLMKLASAFGIPVEELYEAAGYIKNAKIPYKYKETPEDLWHRAMSATPVTLPVCRDFAGHAGEPVEPAEYVHIDRIAATGKDLYAFKVHGDCLSPEINDGDTLIVDRRADVKSGDRGGQTFYRGRDKTNGRGAGEAGKD